MMRIFLLFSFFLVPLSAHAQTEYDLTCDNVARIVICRVAAEPWGVNSPDGYFHVVGFDLTEEAIPGWRDVLHAAPDKVVLLNFQWIHRPDLVITIHGVPLKNDTPKQTGFHEQGVAMGIISEQDARQAARMVCPGLVPDAVLMDGHCG